MAISRAPGGFAPRPHDDVAGQRADDRGDRPGQKPKDAAIDAASLHPVKVVPIGRPHVERRGGDRESHARGNACPNDGKNPQRGHGDMHERLEPLPNDKSNRLPRRELDELPPRWRQWRNGVDHQRNEREAEDALQYAAVSSCRALRLQATAKRETESKSDRKKELRHDGVGVTAVGVVMRQHRRRHVERAREIDQEHAGDGVAAELVEGGDSAGLRGKSRHARLRVAGPG